jgi:hypothetical protein
MTGAGSGACTGASALCCADMPCSISRGAAAAAVHSCDFGSPTSAIAQCVPEEAPPPASPGTSDADTVSTVFWRFCGGPCTVSKSEAPTSSSPPPVACNRQSLQLVLWRWCWQMLAPPSALVLADARPPALLACAPLALVLADARPPALLACAPDALVLAEARPPALLACAPDALVLAEARPPHSLHLLLMRWCWQMLAPPHSLHWLLLRWCWQMPAPPHQHQSTFYCSYRNKI